MMTTGSFFTLLGYLTGGLVFYFAARRKRIATEGVGYVALAGVCGGVLGARLTQWALLHWPDFAANPLVVFDPRAGGRALLGGIAGGWLAVELVKWRLGLRRSTGDLFALALPAGEAVGRIGCFLNGCCHGMPTNVPWAIYQHDTWRHPTQIYSAVFAAALFAVLLALRKRLTKEGVLFKAYLGWYGAGRFVIEFYRADRVPAGPLSLVQWCCLGMMAYAWLLPLVWKAKILKERKCR